MTLRPGEERGHGIAVFPFLKTSEPVRLGNFIFRSTDDNEGLGEDDAAHVREIAEMLFLKDDLRIKSAAYAMLPAIDLDRPAPCLRELEQIQTIVAYAYGSPDPTFDKTFFHFEQASLAIFSPEPVIIFLVRPDHNVESVAADSGLTPDEWHRVPGYEGRYNFRQPFWVAKGSRLYPPVPHISLNISQDLSRDLAEGFHLPQHHLLPALLRQPAAETAERAFTAMTWYNRANAFTSEEESAIIDLAIAFETLLALPRDAKTDRFVDSVSLLLGRIDRLNLWAEQFYAARSEIAHEGKSGRLHFMPVKPKNAADGNLYHPLLTYGRQIFRLCLGTLLFGAQMGEKAGLRDRLVTNQERFQQICKILDEASLPVPDRFAAIDEPVSLISEFRFAHKTGLLIETMTGAVQRAARNLLACDESLEPVFKQRIEQVAAAQRSDDCFEILRALQRLNELKITGPQEYRSAQDITRRLSEVVWGYTFNHYFWLKRQRDETQPPTA